MKVCSGASKFIIGCILLGCALMIPSWRCAPKLPDVKSFSVKNPDNVFVLNFVDRALVMEYDEKTISLLHFVHEPPRSWFTQVSYSPKHRAVLATFGPNEDGPELALRAALNKKDILSGLLIEHETGKREKIRIPYGPYNFVIDGDDIFVDTAAMKTRSNDDRSEYIKGGPGDKLYADILKFSVSNRKVVESYPAGGATGNIKKYGNTLYSFYRWQTVDLQSKQVKTFMDRFADKWEWPTPRHMRTSDGKLFFYIPNSKDDSHKGIKNNIIRMGHLYQIVNRKPVDVFNADLGEFAKPVVLGTDIYLFGTTSTAGIVRYDTITGKVKKYKLPGGAVQSADGITKAQIATNWTVPQGAVISAAANGRKLIFITKPNDENLNVIVADPDFSHVIIQKIAMELVSGISTSEGYFGSR
jgi:hypothetical protein